MQETLAHDKLMKCFFTSPIIAARWGRNFRMEDFDGWEDVTDLLSDCTPAVLKFTMEAGGRCWRLQDLQHRFPGVLQRWIPSSCIGPSFVELLHANVGATLISDVVPADGTLALMAHAVVDRQHNLLAVWPGETAPDTPKAKRPEDLDLTRGYRVYSAARYRS